ncbi:hypothetical protein [Candidatus Palauibacter sp.]|uniref:hypothetical protein n=1 Tax=Candidatus Palauibacter sp. TaxID=3101350 RepID=UPI003AF23BC7
MITRYRVSALTEHDIASLLRLAACLGRHRIEIESFSLINPPGSTIYEHELIVRAQAERVRRAVKQIGAFVGVVSITCRVVESDVSREAGG